MKTQIIIVIFSLFTMGAKAQQSLKSDTIYVNGECESCKKRIETTATKAGAKQAIWNENTHLLVVTYDTARLTIAQLSKQLAAVGHDTPLATASKAAYNHLPDCCKYERKPLSAKP